LEKFLDDRVLGQANWYHKTGRFRLGQHLLLENVARVSLIVAFGVSAAHLTMLFVVPHDASHGRTPAQVAVEAVAITPPPLGSAAIALQLLLQGRSLSRLYRRQGRLLSVLSCQLHDLKEQIAARERLVPDESLTPERADLELKRLVLRTEELLANEQQQWWQLMHAGEDAAEA